MHLTAREKDKLLIAMAAVVTRRRLERCMKLNIVQGFQGRIGGPLGG
jgi:urease gamma subunit